MSVLMSATIFLGVDGRKVGEVLRAKQPFFLAGDGDEEDRPPELDPDSWSMAATSSIAATPEALSIAPL